jgi:hypothetical protein
MWVISLLAVPALYVVTAPPILVIVNRCLPSSLAAANFGKSYLEPYQWLWNQAPLRRPLRAYWNFWVENFGYRGPPDH